MSNRFRKSAMILVFVMICAIVASCSTPTAAPTTPAPTTGSGAAATTTSAPAASGKVFDKPTEIKIMMGSHASWPYNKDWIVWKYIEEATGAKLVFDVHPGAEFLTKVTLALTSKETLPDIMHFGNNAVINANYSSGAFLDITSQEEHMPAYMTWKAKTPESAGLIEIRTSGDGKAYMFPTFGFETILNLRSWLYRKDIFAKNNLQPPKDTEEMYQAAKKLKGIYPDSYPLAFRSGLGNIAVMGPQWSPYFSPYIYYHRDEKKWHYGAIESTMKDLITYFNRMYDEQLVPPDYLTIDVSSWQQLVAQSKGFMMPEYIVRIDFFNKPARVKEPDYTWAMMPPPKSTLPGGQQKLPKYNVDTTGFAMLNTGKAERVVNAARFIDWYYTPQAIELLSWGKANETYKVVNNVREYILDEKQTPSMNLYGFRTYSAYQVIDPTANEAAYSKENVADARATMPYVQEAMDPSMWLPFNEKQQQTLTELADPLSTFVQGELSKFLLKKRPLSEFDAFVGEVNSKGLDRYLKTYEEALNAVSK